ncbi:hypothetical protein [Endozoicomonas sp. YOMI1]|uniref:hypothetical protein n=1 Tax=Endozoicomonas sp. YOMI1 TaxID=2828739 RepID=UPI002148EB93|nr:hypothetical protein [Endozoicomonas sp. YOMI1]
MAGLSVVLASSTTAEDVMVRGSTVSVSGNYDSAGIDNAGSLNIDMVSTALLPIELVAQLMSLRG